MGLMSLLIVISPAANAITLQIPARPTEFPLVAESSPDAGFVVAWGGNPLLITQVPSGLTNVVQVSTGQAHSAALKSDGSVVDWGKYMNYRTLTWFTPSIPVGLTNVVQISCGISHTTALKSDGLAVAWGDNTYGQTNVPLVITNIVQISAGGWHSLALNCYGQVTEWGIDNGGISMPLGLSNVIQVSAGSSFSLALKSDGTVVAWGNNNYGQCSVPNGLTNVVQIDAGANHAVALKADGSVVAWGYNGNGETNIPYGLNNIVQVAAGDGDTIALKNNGTISVWGYSLYGLTNIPIGITNIAQVDSLGQDAIVIVVPNEQVIRQFAPINTKTYGSSFQIFAPQSSSLLPVSVSVKSGPATISNNQIIITGVGNVVLAANQPGTVYDYKAAPEATTSFDVIPAQQTLTPVNLTNSFGFGSGSLNLAPTNQLGLPLIYNVISGPATLSSNILTLTGIGTVTLSTSQAGNQNYSPTSITNTYTIKKAQTITPITPVPTKTYGGEAFGIKRPLASSGLPVSLSVLSGPATISGTNVAISGAGTVVVAANQLGNSNYAVAPQITTSFTVNKANQTISLKGVILPTKTGSYAIPNIKSSAGLPVTFGCTYGDVSQTGPNQITINSAGAVTITADQPGNANYNPAPQVLKGFMVAKSPQTISLSRVSIPTVPGTYDIPVIYSSAGLPVIFNFISGPVADAGGGRYTIYALGNVVVSATQAGNGAYLPAKPVRVSFRIK